MGNDSKGQATVAIEAFELVANPGYLLEPYAPRRDWMDAAPFRTPYRCLPMVMANQAGWVVRAPCNITATWNGKQEPEGVRVEIADARCAALGIAMGHFGLGILTFRLPWLFRTPDGIGLWVRGPANEPKDNATALEGLVETFTSTSPFTMNWKLQRRNSPVYFKKGDPVCTLTPFPMDLLERCEPVIKPISANPALLKATQDAMKSRTELVRQQDSRDQQEVPDWEKVYMQGRQPDGSRHSEHKTNFKIKPFVSG